MPVQSMVQIGVTVIAMLAFGWLFPFLGLWFQARLSGARVSLLHIIAMRFRKVDEREVVLAQIRLGKAGIEVAPDRIEAHALAGGRIVKVVDALIASRKAQVDLDWDTAAGIDLRGGNIDAEDWGRQGPRPEQAGGQKPPPEATERVMSAEPNLIKVRPVRES